MTFECEGVCNRNRRALRAGGGGGAGVHEEVLAAVQAEVRGVVADAEVTLSLRVVGVLLRAVLVEVVRVAVVPASIAWAQTVRTKRFARAMGEGRALELFGVDGCACSGSETRAA